MEHVVARKIFWVPLWFWIIEKFLCFCHTIYQFDQTIWLYWQRFVKEKCGSLFKYSFLQMLNPLSRHLLATVHLKNAHAECYLSSLDHSSGAFSHNWKLNNQPPHCLSLVFLDGMLQHQLIQSTALFYLICSVIWLHQDL